MRDRLFILFQHLLPQHTLSRIAGRLGRSTWAPFKNTFIRWFIGRYEVNMEEARLPNAEDYSCFNDFFTRELKPGARPLDGDESIIVSPADGVINQSGRINHDRLIQAKGSEFSLTELLGGSAERAAPFLGGCFATVYLAPKDYHRVHMPLDGTLKEMVYLPGRLFSVNQVTSESVPNLFALNERVVCIFDTARGPMAMVLVGAMIVAGVHTVWAGNVCPGNRLICATDYRQQQPPVLIGRGQEMGHFKLGSTVVLIFGADAVALLEGIGEGRRVLMGQALARPLDQAGQAVV